MRTKLTNKLIDKIYGTYIITYVIITTEHQHSVISKNQQIKG